MAWSLSFRFLLTLHRQVASKTASKASLSPTRNSSSSPPKKYPSFVKIVEVGPRDGLQNEKTILPTSVKVDFINQLSSTGLRVIETTSFVNTTLVPQMRDNTLLFKSICKNDAISYPVLVPNMKGLQQALDAGVSEVAVFASASDAFSLRNVNCNASKALETVEAVTKEALARGLRVRGYVSCCLGCPYEGEIHPEKVAKIAERLYTTGCYEISLGDTIGVGTPSSMSRLLQEVVKYVPVANIAVHCHDTYGQALPNILTALEFGVSTVDSSVAGLGGCPFAEGATGNVATEDVVYMLDGLGIKTGVDLRKLVEISDYICYHLKRETASRAGKAIASRKKTQK